MGCLAMRTSHLKIAALAVGTALIMGGPARAATIDYIFTGLGSGTLGLSDTFGSAPTGPDVSFTVTIVGDTGGVSGGPIFYSNLGVGTFTSGLLNATLNSGSEAYLYNGPAGIANVAFGQTVPCLPCFVSEALYTDALLGYDLTTAFSLTGGSVSFGQETYLTDHGNLTFTSISSLTFEAILPAAETPLPAALPLFATGLGALGLLGWRRKRKAAALAA
jgi:hypothetical protein